MANEKKSKKISQKKKLGGFESGKKEMADDCQCSTALDTFLVDGSLMFELCLRVDTL
jgi:hypothetical protein